LSSDLLIESGDSSRTNFRTSNAFGAHWISAAMNALPALPREMRGQTNGQEMTGGACSKMDAPRNGAGTQIGFSTESFEN
jgi:hypothetical protein